MPIQFTPTPVQLSDLATISSSSSSSSSSRSRNVLISSSVHTGYNRSPAPKTVQETLEVTSEEQDLTSDPLDDDGLTYPDDKAFKRQAWLDVLGTFIGLIPGWGLANIGGVAATELANNELKDTPATTISWIFSVYLCLSLVATVFSGPYFDRNGAKLPIFVATIMLSGGLLAMSFAKLPYQYLLSFGFCAGTGAGIAGPIICSVAHWFPKKKRATAMAIAGNGGTAGGVLLTLILRQAYDSVGYRWAMRIVALVSLVCLTTSFFLVRERQLVERKALNRTEKLEYYLKGTVDLGALLKDKRYATNVVGCVLTECSTIIAGTYYSYICYHSGFSQNDAFLFVLIMNIFSVPARLLSGYVADKYFGCYNTIIGLLITTALINMCVWMPFKDNRAANYAYSILYGITYGGQLSLVPSCLSTIVRAENLGSLYSTQYLVTGLAVLGMLPAGSAIVGDGSSSGRNDGFIIYVSVMGIIAAAFYLATKVMTIGWKATKF